MLFGGNDGDDIAQGRDSQRNSRISNAAVAELASGPVAQQRAVPSASGLRPSDWRDFSENRGELDR
jgi:hypothetical protein